MLKGFKEFIFRGNAVDLAVGVVIGAAFSSIVNSLVTDILTPFIGALVKVPDFTNLSFTINSSRFMYGNFLNQLVSFILIALAVYFFVIVPMNTVVGKLKQRQGEPPSTDKQCEECLSTIPVAAIRCAHCAQVVKK